MDSFHSVPPSNFFYTWYVEICRRMMCIPSRIIKPPNLKYETVLDFEGDSLKAEDWIPFVIALRGDNSLQVVSIKSKLKNCIFLHHIDTEEKVNNLKRAYGFLWTDYILCQLTTSLALLLRHSKVLTVLELDGLPMLLEYLEYLTEALKKNKTLKYISLANSAIKDEGCEILCEYLQNAPNVEFINFSGCQLSSKSGEYIAKLIQKQQIHRDCRCWPKSKNKDLKKNGINGIKRISLNCNADFDDEGFDYILDELEHDTWIKALDLQYCNITDNLASKILDIIKYNKYLEVVDLRNNYFLKMETVEGVLQILSEKHNIEYQPEFQFYDIESKLTLNSNEAIDLNSSLTLPIQEVKSVPTKYNYFNSTSTQLEMVEEKLDNEYSNQDTSTIISETNSKSTVETQIEQLPEKLGNENSNQESSTTITDMNSNKTKTNQIRKKPEKKNKPFLQKIKKHINKIRKLIRQQETPAYKKASSLTQTSSSNDTLASNSCFESPTYENKSTSAQDIDSNSNTTHLNEEINDINAFAANSFSASPNYKTKPTPINYGFFNLTNMFLKNPEETMKELNYFTEQLTSNIICNVQIKSATEVQMRNILGEKIKKLEKQLNQVQSPQIKTAAASGDNNIKSDKTAKKSSIQKEVEQLYTNTKTRKSPINNKKIKKKCKKTKSEHLIMSQCSTTSASGLLRKFSPQCLKLSKSFENL